MALTAIDIRPNKDEYSRYESARSIVKVRIIPTPFLALVDETVEVAIIKKGIAIATKSITFNGDSNKGAVIEFDLNSINDDSGNTHINRGEYQITATQGIVSNSHKFKVAIITADEMRKSYCQGLHLVSGYKLAPKCQPSAVTGVVITNVSKGTNKGVKALVYNSTNATLQYDGGVVTPIDDLTESAILIGLRSNYIEVDIDYYALPSTDAQEGILLDADELHGDYIQSEIEKATQEVESLLKIMLEPTRIATEPYYSNPAEGEYFDQPATPVCFYEKDYNRRSLGWHISLPYNQIGKVSDLIGYIGNTKALELKSGALCANRKNGNVDILPYNSSYAMYYTFFIGMNFYGSREFIADFWRYKAIIGINEKIPAEIIKMIGLTSAISILITAEQAYRAGLTSESISKDGVSRSQSYAGKGVYDSTIQEYKDYLKVNMPKFRSMYRGIPCMVL